jgi:hypothetical protein
MALTTVAQPTTGGKPAKAFYAHLYGQAGTLAKVEGTIYFTNLAKVSFTNLGS